ncbi:hypothetical protein CUR85_04030 [Sulfitobacter faviae]|nr:hypothetical protein [Sulfitobacter faviae]
MGHEVKPQEPRKAEIDEHQRQKRHNRFGRDGPATVAQGGDGMFSEPHMLHRMDHCADTDMQTAEL